MEVEIGHEVGIGEDTKIFTHGAYLSEYDGFPVSFAPVAIGNNVWLPNAWVNPGVNIGNDVVVAARSLINKDLPSGCLAGGIPVEVMKIHRYPRILTIGEKHDIVIRILERCKLINCVEVNLNYYDQKDYGSIELKIADCKFYIDERKIEGKGTENTERLKNQLRRHGIRFRYYLKNGEYVPWD